VVSVTPWPHFTPGIGGCVGPTAGLDTEVKGKILCRGSSPDRLIAQSVVRHYTDWSTRLRTERNPKRNYP
jgi:hypothetical protein